MKNQYFYFFLLFFTVFIVISSHSSTAATTSILNSTGTLAYTTDLFNTTTASETVSFAGAGSNADIGLKVPNGTITAVVFNMAGVNTVTLVKNVSHSSVDTIVNHLFAYNDFVFMNRGDDYVWVYNKSDDFANIHNLTFEARFGYELFAYDDELFITQDGTEVIAVYNLTSWSNDRNVSLYEDSYDMWVDDKWIYAGAHYNFTIFNRTNLADFVEYHYFYGPGTWVYSVTANTEYFYSATNINYNLSMFNRTDRTYIRDVVWNGTIYDMYATDDYLYGVTFGDCLVILNATDLTSVANKSITTDRGVWVDDAGVIYTGGEIFNFDGSTITLNMTYSTHNQDVWGDSDYIYTTGPYDVEWLLVYSRFAVPSAVTVEVNNTAFFDYSGNLSANTTTNFFDYINDYLSDATTIDSDGFITTALNITSDTAGNLTIDTLELNYTYSQLNTFSVYDWWNETTDISAGEVVAYAKKYDNIAVPGADLNIDGVFINSTATSCAVDTVSGVVVSFWGTKYCNLSSALTLDKSGGGSWTNISIWDDTMATGTPVKQTNASQTFNTTHRYIMFNVTGYYPNGTVADNIYNVTTEIQLDDSLLDSVHSQGLLYYNGSDWLELNTTTACANVFTVTETNYSNKTINGEVYQACYNDTDSDGVKDYFKARVPHLSVQQFMVYGEEDTTNPNITIIKPTGTYTSASNIAFNVTATDDVATGVCKYNITDDAGGVETAMTIISCSNFTGVFTISGGNDDYLFNAWVNDTSGHTNTSQGTFTVTVPASSPPAAGGGGSVDDTEVHKLNCDIIVDPLLLDFYTDIHVLQLNIHNNENFSFTPVYTVDTVLYEIRGATDVVFGLTTSELSILRVHALNSSVNSTIMITSETCKDINITIAYYNTTKSQEQVREMTQTMLNTILGKVAMFGVSVPFYVISLVVALIIMLIMYFAETTTRSKVLGGVFLFVFVNVFLGFMVNVEPASASKVEALENITTENYDKVMNATGYNVVDVDIGDTALDIDLWWIIIALLFVLTGVGFLFRVISWPVKVMIIITLTALLSWLAYYLLNRMNG